MHELRRYRRAIAGSGVSHALIQAPEALIGTADWGWQSLCYLFSGMVNPLRCCRYPGVRPLAPLFDWVFFRSLRRAAVVLAAADLATIEDFKRTFQRELRNRDILQFPSAVDLQVWHPTSKLEASHNVGLRPTVPRIAFCGRLNRVKGWDLILEAFAIVRREFRRDAELVVIGDGEDRGDFTAAVSRMGLVDSVTITGFQPPEVAVNYINASDIVVFGSIWEGWSNVMNEALACGKPIVTTKVSGATTLLSDPANGIIVPSRDPLTFARAIVNAFEIQDPEGIRTRTVAGWSVDRLADRLTGVWLGQDMP
ncbi:MAG TPA: glycosyltransferase [Bryobacteraceae bacterium]|nr:glycosyltransferase [Bryobacteraceae bacterium]